MIIRKHIIKMVFLLMPLTALTQVSYEYLRSHQTGRHIPYAGSISSQKVVIPSHYRPSTREMRGVWVATVRNIDFSAHTSVTTFKRDFIQLVNNLKGANFNTLIFQVRPTNDAFYQSEINPWSRFFTGHEGQGIANFDPLQFMIAETHKRGLEFHAWLNPYRVTGDTNLNKTAYLKTLSWRNFARRHPNLVLSVANGKSNMLLLNPGEPEVIKFITATVSEILGNYEVDAIHLDDYFYPYQDIGNVDALTFKRYSSRGENVFNWRRSNVDQVIQKINLAIRSHNRRTNRQVKFGVSPFGIWANKKDHPQGSLTKGLQSYSVQYANTLKWVQRNWIDYIVPQIYWTFETDAAPYAALVDWWASAVRGTRTQLYIGHAAYQPGKSERWNNPHELANQLRYNTRHPEIRGTCFFSYRSIFAPDNITQRRAMEKIILEYWKYPAKTP